MRHNLLGQAAIVTGGGSGIGRAIALSLAERGCRCALVGRRAEALDSVVGELATPGLAIEADVTEHDSHDRILSETEAALGPVNILVHGAGQFASRPIEDTTDEVWHDIMAVNLTAVMALTRAAWPTLGRTSGQVLMISSIATSQAFPGNAAYASSKAGMDALAEVLSLEGQEEGIRILTINPAQTNTDLWDNKAPPEVRERMMRPETIGELAASLLTIDRGVDISAVRIRPVADPWQED